MLPGSTVPGRSGIWYSHSCSLATRCSPAQGRRSPRQTTTLSSGRVPSVGRRTERPWPHPPGGGGHLVVGLVLGRRRDLHVSPPARPAGPAERPGTRARNGRLELGTSREATGLEPEWSVSARAHPQTLPGPAEGRHPGALRPLSIFLRGPDGSRPGPTSLSVSVENVASDSGGRDGSPTGPGGDVEDLGSPPPPAGHPARRGPRPGARSEGRDGTGHAEEEGRATPVVSRRRAPLVPIRTVEAFGGGFTGIRGWVLPAFGGGFEVASGPLIGLAASLLRRTVGGRTHTTRRGGGASCFSRPGGRP